MTVRDPKVQSLDLLLTGGFVCICCVAVYNLGAAVGGIPSGLNTLLLWEEEKEEGRGGLSRLW